VKFWQLRKKSLAINGRIIEFSSMGEVEKTPGKKRNRIPYRTLKGEMFHEEIPGVNVRRTCPQPLVVSRRLYRCHPTCTTPSPPVAVQPQEPPMTTNVELPPVREEVMVPAPSPQHIWIPGYWAWNGRWVWEPGYWVILSPCSYAQWVPGRGVSQAGFGFLGIGDTGDSPEGQCTS